MENQNLEPWHLYESLSEEDRTLHTMRKNDLKKMRAEELLAWQKIEASRKAYNVKLLDDKIRQNKENFNKLSPGQKRKANTMAAVIVGIIGSIAVLIIYRFVIYVKESPPMAIEVHADGSVFCCKEWLRTNLNDWDSYESIEWTKPIKMDNGAYLVSNKFRARNGFGGYRIATYVFLYTENGTVLKAKQTE